MGGHRIIFFFFFLLFLPSFYFFLPFSFLFLSFSFFLFYMMSFCPFVLSFCIVLLYCPFVLSFCIVLLSFSIAYFICSLAIPDGTYNKNDNTISSRCLLADTSVCAIASVQVTDNIFIETIKVRVSVNHSYVVDLVNFVKKETQHLARLYCFIVLVVVMIWLALTHL